MITETSLIPRQSLAQMAESWQVANGEIKQAIELLTSASNRLTAAFTESTDYAFGIDLYYRGHNHNNVATVLHEMQKQAWSHLIARMELRKFMSIADNEKLDKQLQTGEGMPEITLP